MTRQVLIDSSFFYEFNNPQTLRKPEMARFAQTENRVWLVPDVVLTEVTYLLRKRIGQHYVIHMLTHIDSLGFQFEAVLIADLKRAGQIMAQYRDADLDFVDCCLMAMSERLTITTIYTYDRRDFGIFRPTHCDYLELLP
jgi:predicted nucleic acid-binding protein